MKIVLNLGAIVNFLEENAFAMDKLSVNNAQDLTTV
jgi:hypothetical protein